MMFLLLGLLVTPSEFLPVALPALAVALGLMLVARPLAVWVSVLPFRVPWREQLFMSWVGLRGAVPIVLATFPLLAGLDQDHVYFNTTFIVVLLSLLVQGWTIAPLARVLNLEVPPRVKPLQQIDLDIPGQFHHELLGYQLEADSIAAGKAPTQLPLPPEVEIASVIRGTQVMNVATLGPLEAGDYVYVLAVPEHVESLNRMFGVAHGPARLEEHRFFGDFVLAGDARVADVEEVYGIRFPGHGPDETLAAFMSRAFRGVPMVGDRLRAGAVVLVVREVERGVVTRVGLKLHD
jgi:cell volume regulation protein A